MIQQIGGCNENRIIHTLLTVVPDGSGQVGLPNTTGPGKNKPSRRILGKFKAFGISTSELCCRAVAEMFFFPAVKIVKTAVIKQVENRKVIFSTGSGQGIPWFQSFPGALEDRGSR